MNLVPTVVTRPSLEFSLVGLEGIVLTDKGRDVIVRNPSRVYFRKDGKVTVRSYSRGFSVTLSVFKPVTAWTSVSAVSLTVASENTA